MRLSLKKEFQSRISGVVCVVLVGSAGVEESEAVEAERTDIAEGLIERGKEICRFASGTRRCVTLEELSVDRVLPVAGVCEWNGVRRVGCMRQPRAAVRRVGAVQSMLGGGEWS